MLLKKLIDEDFVNYKKPSMVLGFPHCTFKCDRECGQCVCQNSSMAKATAIDVNIDDLVVRYSENPITSAVVLQGLEPLDDMEQLKGFIEAFRKSSNDDIVIYTGYKKDESLFTVFYDWLVLNKVHNIVIKYGRFIPNKPTRYDSVLGVTLASDNQMAMYLA